MKKLKRFLPCNEACDIQENCTMNTCRILEKNSVVDFGVKRVIGNMLVLITTGQCRVNDYLWVNY